MTNQKLLDGLVKTLALEKFEENLFRGQSEKTSWGRVFGCLLYTSDAADDQ